MCVSPLIDELWLAKVVDDVDEPGTQPLLVRPSSWPFLVVLSSTGPVYASAPEAAPPSRAARATPASKLVLWQLGMHVAELVVGRDGAAAGAHRDERAVVAFLPRRQRVELAAAAPRAGPAGRRCARSTSAVAGEPRARVERRPARWCRRAAVDLARPHVHAVDGGNPRFGSSRRNAIFSSTKWQVSQPLPRARRRADVMHVPLSGLSPRRPATDEAASCPFGAAALARG